MAGVVAIEAGDGGVPVGGVGELCVRASLSVCVVCTCVHVCARVCTCTCVHVCVLSCRILHQSKAVSVNERVSPHHPWIGVHVCVCTSICVCMRACICTSICAVQQRSQPLTSRLDKLLLLQITIALSQCRQAHIANIAINAGNHT